MEGQLSFVETFFCAKTSNTGCWKKSSTIVESLLLLESRKEK